MAEPYKIEDLLATAAHTYDGPGKWDSLTMEQQRDYAIHEWALSNEAAIIVQSDLIQLTFDHRRALLKIAALEATKP